MQCVRECSISPSVSTLSVAAFVEGRHGFIRRPGLNLHKISSGVLTFGTGFCKKKNRDNQTNTAAFLDLS